MIDHVVVDVEIARAIEEVESGWSATDKLGVAVACVWEYKTQRMRVYGPDDVLALRERLLNADKISGYNIWNFDFPVIWGLSRKEWRPSDGEIFLPGNVGSLRNTLISKTNDMLRRIWAALGVDPDKGPAGLRGTSLEAIASATLGVGKIGNGADAPKWYQAGKIQQVCNYCCDDVALERDLADFIDRYGYVLHDGVKLVLKR